MKERSGLACDHYRRFADDFDIAVQLGQNTHRFSLEWSRIEPVEGQWNDEALAHYLDVVRALRQRHVEPLVTLHHFTTPQWLTAQGGWTNAKVVERFARFTERVVAALGDSVRYWITINEPMIFARMHYLQGLGPPGVRHLKQSLRVIEHTLRAHAVAYHVLHHAKSAQTVPPKVSIAHNYPSLWPCHRWWVMDRLVTRMTDRLVNHAYLEALTEGRWSVPGHRALRIPEAAATLDFIGVNFYGRQFLRWLPLPRQWVGSACNLDHHPREVTERTSFGWDVHPPSFTEALIKLSQFRLPLFVTENGAYMINDARRWSYLLRHVQAMAQAMQQGVSVIGYCYWSLLDNFEWADGFTPRFGITEVDYATQQRRVRDSGKRYADICRTNSVALAS